MIYWCSRKVALTVFTEMCSASFFIAIKKYSQRNVQSKKEMCSQRNSVGTDRKNFVPGIYCASYQSSSYHITEKGLGHFLTALKASKTHKELHHCLMTLKVLMLKKGFRHFLMNLKVFNIEKGHHHFFETLKGFNFEK